MKIIVDEMPKSVTDCAFIGGLNTCLLTHEECGLYNGECQHLKPISDYHAYKVLQKHNGDMTMAEVFDIL